MQEWSTIRIVFSMNFNLWLTFKCIVTLISLVLARCTRISYATWYIVYWVMLTWTNFIIINMKMSQKVPQAKKMEQFHVEINSWQAYSLPHHNIPSPSNAWTWQSELHWPPYIYEANIHFFGILNTQLLHNITFYIILQ